MSNRLKSLSSRHPLATLWRRARRHLPQPSPAPEAYRRWRDRFVRRRLGLAMGLLALVFGTFLVLELGNLLWSPENFKREWLTTQAIALIALVGYELLLRSPWGRRRVGGILILFSITVSLLPLVQRAIAGELVPSLLLWPALFFGQATLVPVRWRLHLVAQAIPLGTYFLLQQTGMPERTFAELDGVAMWLYFGWIGAICLLSVYLHERLRKSEMAARQEREAAFAQLEEEQKQSERLLLNVLPRAIAQRLKQQTQHSAIADSFANAGVLFADIVGFTELSGRISPPELVELLNDIFSEFDRLADLHGLEKIKTIGDAYMVVSGLPEAREDYAEAIADMALDMRRALHQFNENHQTLHQHQFRMRVGIAIGPVVAGVIGLRKFIYDLWGDTVNLASRMESHGVPDAVQVTADTYECLKDRYEFQPRGEIEIKGKGKMKTYLLVGKLAGDRPQSQTASPPSESPETG